MSLALNSPETFATALGFQYSSNTTRGNSRVQKQLSLQYNDYSYNCRETSNGKLSGENFADFSPNLCKSSSLFCESGVTKGTKMMRFENLWKSEKRSLKFQASAAATPTSPSPEQIVPEIHLPTSIHEISNGDRILGFGADLAEDHPGFHDAEYKERRTYIAHLAKTHIVGEPIPDVEYTEAETYVWAEVLTKLSKLYPTHACKEYIASFPIFDFTKNRVPQLQELSEILKERTGWQIRPVAGLLHPRDFLNGLAFKYFHSTQYIRHGSNPMYTPEPDLCHELLGHVPMLADPAFAELAHAIGVASLGASEKEIWHLTKLYWYTVEFGVVKEGDELKAFGAGLLSSFGELEWLQSGHPAFLELDPFSKLPKMSYKDGYQKTYFLCASFPDVAEKLRAYAKSIQRVEAMAYQ